MNLIKDRKKQILGCMIYNRRRKKDFIS